MGGRGIAWVALALASTAGFGPRPARADESMHGDALLAKAIEYHDGQGAWSRGTFRLTLESRRPDGSRRRTVLVLDNGTGGFSAERETEAGPFVAQVGPGERCELSLAGSTDIPADAVDTLNLTCDRWRLLRDYYSYMWGLPMKLRDPGTRVDPQVGTAEFQGRPTDVLRVTYASEVGGDTWYLYFEPGTGRAMGYRFYHDEPTNDGEYIVLEGEVEAGGVRFPRTQTWYMNDDDELLGSDVLVAAERLP